MHTYSLHSDIARLVKHFIYPACGFNIYKLPVVTKQTILQLVPYMVGMCTSSQLCTSHSACMDALIITLYIHVIT